MEVDSHDTIDAHGLKETSNISSRNGDTRSHLRIVQRLSSYYLSVLSGIAVVGNDSGDSAGRGTADGGDHEHQLHEVVVDVGRAGGLQIRPQTQHVPG